MPSAPSARPGKLAAGFAFPGSAMTATMTPATVKGLGDLTALAMGYLVAFNDASWFRTALEIGGFDHVTATRMTNAMLSAVRNGRAFQWSWPAQVEV